MNNKTIIKTNDRLFQSHDEMFAYIDGYLAALGIETQIYDLEFDAPVEVKRVEYKTMQAWIEGARSDGELV
jgi:hypothetical protein